MSKRLDEELAEAALAKDDASIPTDAEGEEEGPASTRGVERPAEEAASPKKKSHLGLLVALLAMAGAVVALVFVGFDGASVYEVTVGELVSGEHTERKVRVGGDLVPGSLKKRDSPCEHRFVMESNEQRMEVRYPQCVIPDTFVDRPEGGVEVTVEGVLREEGHFEASLVMAKCTSKYDPASHEMQAAQQEPGDKPEDQPIR